MGEFEPIEVALTNGQVVLGGQQSDGTVRLCKIPSIATNVYHVLSSRENLLSCSRIDAMSFMTILCIGCCRFIERCEI